MSKDIALKQKEEIHRFQSENIQLSKSYEEKASKVENLNIELLETKNKLSAVEQTLKDKEERLASNDKGNTFNVIQFKANNNTIINLHIFKQ